MDTVRGVRTLWTLLAGHAVTSAHSTLVPGSPEASQQTSQGSMDAQGETPAEKTRTRRFAHRPRAALCKLAALLPELNRGSEKWGELWSPSGKRAVLGGDSVLTVACAADAPALGAHVGGRAV